MEAAQRLGYRPNRAARALAKGQSDLVALWAPRGGVRSSATLAAEFERLARSHGMDLVMRTAPFDEVQSALIDLEDWPIGFTVLFDCGEAPWIEMAGHLDHPVLAIGEAPVADVDCVFLDEGAACRLLLEHLASQGAKSVLHLSALSESDPDDLRAADMRESASGLKLKLTQNVCVDGSFAGVLATIRRTLEKGIPDAIGADTAVAGAAALRALSELGRRVPQDCLVAALSGGIEAQLIQPSLTTVDFPAGEVAQKAWRLLESRQVDSRRDPILDSVTPRLIVRESSKRSS